MFGLGVSAQHPKFRDFSNRLLVMIFLRSRGFQLDGMRLCGQSED